MVYKNNSEVIPHEDREEINKKILDLIASNNLQGITGEDIYNGYTGDGGLHGLSRSDFENYYKFSEAKKSVEQGQFFTPHSTCQQVAEMLNPSVTETICDPTCGMGSFFNFFNPANCYGSDLDPKAVKVAQFLYPEAKIQNIDILGYSPEQPVDYIVGNPPFNLTWHPKGFGGSIYSQDYFFYKSADMVKLGGIIAVVVPESFMKDSFSDKSSIDRVNESWSFIGQYLLDKATFKDIGVKNYGTKVMFFQRRSDSIKYVPYDHTEFKTVEEITSLLEECKKVRRSMAVKLRSEMLEKYDSDFIYKMNKYLYEIKVHPKLKDYIANSLAYIDKFENQKCPENMSYEEWDKSHKITENMVLSYLKRTVAKQERPKQIDKLAVVKTNYSFKIKPYSTKEKRKLNAPSNMGLKEISITDLVIGIANLTDLDYPVKSSYIKLIEKKRREHKIQCMLFEDMQRDPEIDMELKRFVFRNGRSKRSKFNDLQVRDLGLVLQKKHAILNWQMGSGKTIAGFYWTTCLNTKYNFIVSTALSITNTWKTFLNAHDIDYIIIQDSNDFKKVKEGTYILLSFHYLKKCKREIKNLIRSSGNNVGLLFDESDEITNHTSAVTKNVLALFRRAKRKLLTTGTTTRNNISEIYPQFELLFNNGYNLVNYCEEEFREKKDSETKDVKIVSGDNPNYLKPFSARGGNSQFKRCFNPSKTTVFGVKKHNQKLYNADQITRLIGSTIVTRKFREIAGDKYNVSNVNIEQHYGEKLVYKKIIKEFSTMVGYFYESTGNTKKDAMLNIIRQIQLLIKATSTPQNFPEYSGGIPNKAKKIIEIIGNNPTEKIAIGCTSLDAVNYYMTILQTTFPDRPIFEVTGGDSVKRRGGITGKFEDTENGLMVCTQQSLKSSLNIPSCNRVIIESLQWNIPKIEQFYFRFIRYDSTDKTEVTFVNYENTIEVNLLALLMSKERINDFVKTKEYKEESEVFEEFGIDMDILEQLITKDKDENGKMKIVWEV